MATGIWAADVTLTQLSDSRGETLVQGILRLVDQHDPMQLSLVGGEPMMRHRELSKLLPILSARGIYTMVVTSGVIPIPAEWTSLPRVTVAISVDGLPEHHDERRKPATYERILRNIAGRRVYIHWTAVRAHVQDLSYAERYLEFWSAREEVHRIWMSVYTPQRGEQSAERLTLEDRKRLAEAIPELATKYPKFLIKSGMARAILSPPSSPDGMRLCARVGELHGRPAHARRAVRVRRRSGLLGMRLRHQLRAALDHERKGRPDRGAAFAGCVAQNRRRPWRG